jgi:hypothetical protein
VRGRPSLYTQNAFPRMNIPLHSSPPPKSHTTVKSRAIGQHEVSFRVLGTPVAYVIHGHKRLHGVLRHKLLMSTPLFMPRIAKQSIMSPLRHLQVSEIIRVVLDTSRATCVVETWWCGFCVSGTTGVMLRRKSPGPTLTIIQCWYFWIWVLKLFCCQVIVPKCRT